MSTGIGVERDVCTFAKPIGAASGPIDSWIKNVGPTVRFPFDPSVSLPTEESPFADDETNVFCPVELHPLIQRHCFALAIGNGGRLQFLGRFPLRGETVGNCAQILDPMINEGQRKILLVTIARRKEDRIDSRHLPVVRSRADADVKGFSETRKGKQTDEPDDEGPKLSGDEGTDTYENHNNYGFYKQRQCQSRRLFLATID